MSQTENSYPKSQAAFTGHKGGALPVPVPTVRKVKSTAQPSGSAYFLSLILGHFESCKSIPLEVYTSHGYLIAIPWLQ